ncbi:unnamed protein product [Allacma fusca]|uniref:Uncharacterized protein n=1 Tax=Allacma fusca TaxID=39272 RepID=A0A8J2P2L1_9HEXA|nr:unnamed protein product [Allacma fusca]
MDSVKITSDNLICGLFEDRSYKGCMLQEYIRDRVDSWKDAIAIKSMETGVTYTYSDVLENSRAFASALIKQGFQKGDVIAVVLPNIPEYSSIVFGIWEAGLTASLMNPLYTSEEINYQLDLCRIKSVIVNADSFKTVQCIDGVEKIIMFASALQSVQSFQLGRDQERTIAVLPFFHSYGFQGGIAHSMLKGVHVMTLTKFQPEIFVNAVRQHRPTFFALVPTVVSFLVSDTVTSQDLESTHTVIVGGGPTSPVTVDSFNKKFRASLLSVYGLTELSPLSHRCVKEKAGSVGLPAPMTYSKVVDPETGNSLKKYMYGEICVKGPQVMKGYFDNEGATNAVIDREGWFHTGDWGYFDEENYLFIVDRIKDIIKVKGFQVSPTEIENMLKEHAKVADVAVIGIPDFSAGELPRAFVVPQDGVTIMPEELIDFISGRLANFKHLKGGIEFVDSLPRNPTGKILRKELFKNHINKQFK